MSFLLALLLSQNVWLEMRIHVGKLIPWLMLLYILWGFRKNVNVGFPAVLLLEGVLLSTFLVVYQFQWSALTVIPASLMCEGIYLASLSPWKANVVLVGILAAGNVAWMIEHVRKTAVPTGNVDVESRTQTGALPR